MPQLRVLHVITHLAFGGATETVLTIGRLGNPDRFKLQILAGITSDAEATLGDAAAQAGIPMEILPSLRRPIHPVADHRAYHDMVAWLKQGQWDVVHTHGSKAGILGRLAAAAAGVPVIIHTVHGWGHHDRQRSFVRRFYIAAERRAARVTDKIIVVADANRDKGLCDDIGRHDQYETIHSGIDIDEYRNVHVDRSALRAQFGIPDEAIVVGTVSRLAPQKAPMDFIQMASHIHARRPDTHFVFVGGGPLQAQFEAKVRAAGLGSVVHLLGYREDVPEILRIFDIFALTSHWEGLPRVFAQAMCAQLPIVATRVDGAPEAIIHGETGYLVHPGDTLAQAHYTMLLIDDAAQRTAMGRRGDAMVSPKFSDREMVRRIEELYFTCAAQKGLPAAQGSLAHSVL